MLRSGLCSLLAVWLVLLTGGRQDPFGVPRPEHQRVIAPKPSSQFPVPDHVESTCPFCQGTILLAHQGSGTETIPLWSLEVRGTVLEFAAPRPQLASGGQPTSRSPPISFLI